MNPNYVDTHKAVFKPDNKYRNKSETFIFVGRLSKQKNIPLLLDVFGDLKKKLLLIVGKGELENYLKEMTQQKKG